MSTRLTFRMAAPSVAVGLLLLVLGGASAWYIHRMTKEASKLVEHDAQSIRAAEEVALLLREIRFQLIEFSNDGDREHLAAAGRKIADASKWVAEEENLANDEAGIALAKRVRTGYDQFASELARLPNLASDAQARQQAHRLAYELLSTKVIPYAEDYLDHSEAPVLKSVDRQLHLVSNLALGFLLLGACGSVAGLVAGFGIARGVTQSIVQLYLPIRDAAGRLEEVVAPVEMPRSSGIEDLDAAMRILAEQVGTVVDRLQQSQREVLRSEQLAALGQLAAGLAHELRNPLTAIKILVQSAADGDGAAGLQPRDLTVLAEEIARLERSIQTFLDFARPPQLERRAFDLGEVLQQTRDLVAARAAGQHVQIELDLPDGASIRADREQIRQVILNLLLNSLDALPRGGTISAGVRCEPPSSRARAGAKAADGSAATAIAEGRWLTITVADTGPGIPPELAERIFDPFVSGKETGVGLGLAICRRIVEAHGGTITAANGPRGGAIFTVHLPGSLSTDRG